MEAAVVTADNRVTEDIGRCAVVRGPVVYCMESRDNGDALRNIYADTSADIKEITIEDFGFPVTALEIRGARVTFEGSEEYISALYKKAPVRKAEPIDIRLIPYRLWANRGEGEMSVFIGIL